MDNRTIFSDESTIQINPSEHIVLSISKYTDCLFIIINQTGSIGSLLKAVAIQSSGQFAAEDLNDIDQTEESNIYDIKVMFGATDIDFYTLIFRRILSLAFEDLKAEKGLKVLLNISLPVKKAEFNAQNYYSAIVKEFLRLAKGLL